MKSKFITFILAIIFWFPAKAQEGLVIDHYDVSVIVNKDASLNITETIDVNFLKEMHGIIRRFPYKYSLENLPAGIEKADLQLVTGNKRRVIVKDIKVTGDQFETSTSGDYQEIKIGDKDEYVSGKKQYVISYTLLNAINFFKDHSEFYLNIIGNEWNTSIRAVDFTVKLYKPLPATPTFFVASGPFGSKENETQTNWVGRETLSGSTTNVLQPHEGVTVGISFPQDFLEKPDFSGIGISWLLLPVVIFLLSLYTWKKWGRDEKVTVQTEFYPPAEVSPSVSGYIIDGQLNRRDLTALVPYWGAGGYLKIYESVDKSFLGLVKTTEYEFEKVKDLPDTAELFEKTFFNGIFKAGDRVKLSSLKNVLYETMNRAKKELEEEIDKEKFYVTYTRGAGIFMVIIGLVTCVFGFVYLLSDIQIHLWPGISVMAAGLIMMIFGFFMPKKSKKGTALYAKLLGFKEFVKTVEKDRLREFLKQDANYFDKILPYAIVFNVADTWKDKLKGLEIPPPQWYSGSFNSSGFNMMIFMNSLNKSMNTMSESFYSAPSGKVAGGGGSFSGGGGFSGGGFGGGGGGGW